MRTRPGWRGYQRHPPSTRDVGYRRDIGSRTTNGGGQSDPRRPRKRRIGHSGGRIILLQQGIQAAPTPVNRPVKWRAPKEVEKQKLRNRGGNEYADFAVRNNDSFDLVPYESRGECLLNKKLARGHSSVAAKNPGRPALEARPSSHSPTRAVTISSTRVARANARLRTSHRPSRPPTSGGPPVTRHAGQT